MNNQIGKGSRDRVKNLNVFRENYTEIFNKTKYLCQDCKMVEIDNCDDGAICQNCWEKHLKLNKELYDKEKEPKVPFYGDGY